MHTDKICVLYWKIFPLFTGVFPMASVMRYSIFVYCQLFSKAGEYIPFRRSCCQKIFRSTCYSLGPIPNASYRKGILTAVQWNELANNLIVVEVKDCVADKMQ